MSKEKKFTEDQLLIEPCDDFIIEVEEPNWTVWHHQDIKSKKGDYKKWVVKGYCRDLPAALQCIMRTKSVLRVGRERAKDYLDWYGATCHQIADRVLRKEAELKKAIEKNGVMVNYHNFEE